VNRSSRLIAFWGAVAGVSILANFGIEVLADKFPNSGFAKLTAYTHKGLN
jgi:hypothetical protein